MADGQDEFLSTSEAASILGIKEDAVREAFDRGDLTGMRTRPGPGGHRRPSRVSVEAYCSPSVGQFISPPQCGAECATCTSTIAVRLRAFESCTANPYVPAL
jgi:excisionase family DNA binding protein